jgi:hypothetical protein
VVLIGEEFLPRIIFSGLNLPRVDWLNVSSGTLRTAIGHATKKSSLTPVESQYWHLPHEKIIFFIRLFIEYIFTQK